MKYRIIKRTYADDTIDFVIQRSRFGLFWKKEGADVFKTKRKAEQLLVKIKEYVAKIKVVKEEVV